jgi:ABC-type multidrug transport system fused ATPase/permease subunit
VACIFAYNPIISVGNPLATKKGVRYTYMAFSERGKIISFQLLTNYVYHETFSFLFRARKNRTYFNTLDHRRIVMADLLNVKNLGVSVEDKEILHGVDLTVNKGETHVLMGPNGAGKSTLGNALMGNPLYHITKGQILFNGTDITAEPTDKRARLGMFLSFQNPL